MTAEVGPEAVLLVRLLSEPPTSATTTNSGVGRKKRCKWKKMSRIDPGGGVLAGRISGSGPARCCYLRVFAEVFFVTLQKQHVPAKRCVILHTFAFSFFQIGNSFFQKAFQAHNRGHERHVLERHIPLIGFPRPLTGPPALSSDRTERAARLKVL